MSFALETPLEHLLLLPGDKSLNAMPYLTAIWLYFVVTGELYIGRIVS